MIKFKPFVYLSGLFRSSKKANDLIDEQIFHSLKSISGSFKEAGMLKEIHKEKLRLSKELDVFIKDVDEGKYKHNEKEADLIVETLLKNYEKLEAQVDDLNNIRKGIIKADNKALEKELEFKKEMEEHKFRSFYDLEKGHH